MAEQRKKKPIHRTPKAPWKYPKIVRPDEKYGKYQVDEILNPAENQEHAEFVEFLNEEYDKAVEQARASLPAAKAKKMKLADHPVKPVEDENGEETGEVRVRFKLDPDGKNNKTGETWTNTVKVFDAKGNPITGKKLKGMKIGSGTVGKVGFQCNYFHTAQVGAGLSLRLVAAQIIELVEFGGGNAESYGFGAEDGFDADDIDDDFDDETEDDDGDQENEDDEDDGEGNF